jgi:hypothetical protein
MVKATLWQHTGRDHRSDDPMIAFGMRVQPVLDAGVLSIDHCSALIGIQGWQECFLDG